MATIKERAAKDGTPRYTAEVRLKGYPRQTATFKRKTDAKKWIQDTESAIREGRHFKTVEAKKHTLDELIARYIETEAPKRKDSAHRIQQLNWWRDRLGAFVLADVTHSVIAQHKYELENTTTRRGGKYGAASVSAYIQSLSSAFIFGRELEWVESNPVSNVKKPELPRGRVRFLDDAERTRLLEACEQSSNSCLYTCVILAISTGMRSSELMGLRWSDVNLKDRYIILHETKNGDRRRVPLAGHALELLHQHSKVRRLDTSLLFPSARYPDQPINLRKPFQKALNAAGITDFRWHDLRHCTASYLAMNGASLAEIAGVLGHKQLAMVMRYSHLSDGHVSSVVEKMNAKIFGV